MSFPVKYQVLFVTLAIIFCTTVLGNVFIFYVVIRRNLTKNPIWYYLMSLSMSDFLMAITFTPVTMAAIYDETILSCQSYCNESGFTNVFFASWTILTITAISLYKWRNVNVVVINREKNMKFFYAYFFSTLFLSSFFATIPLTSMSAYIHFKNRFWCYPVADDGMIHASFISAMLVTCLLTPIFLIFISNIAVVFSVKEQVRKQKELPHGTHYKTALELREFKVIKASLRIIIVFAITWSPILIMTAVALVKSHLPQWLAVMSYVFALSQGAINPFVYCLSHATFRTELRYIFLKNSYVEPLTKISNVSRPSTGAYPKFSTASRPSAGSMPNFRP